MQSVERQDSTCQPSCTRVARFSRKTRRFGVKYRCVFLRVALYFDESAGRVKIQTTSLKAVHK